MPFLSLISGIYLHTIIKMQQGLQEAADCYTGVARHTRGGITLCQALALEDMLLKGFYLPFLGVNLSDGHP